jgi:hypothetical protein
MRATDLLPKPFSTRPYTAPPSALPRPLDLTLPSNRTAVIGTVAFGAVALLTGRSWRQALGVGGAGMLGWATGRELDPDYPLSAALALVLAGLTSLSQSSVPGTLSPVLSGFAALSSARVLTATVGAAASPQDTVALAVQAGMAALAGHRVAALMPTAALALSEKETDRLRPEAPWGVPLALGAALLPRLKKDDEGKRPAHLMSDVLSLSALAFSRQLIATEQPHSRADQAPLSLSASRLTASRMLSLGALALGLARREAHTLVPLAAACVATGLRRSAPELSNKYLGITEIKNR